eukprot:4134676-Amphidinium_carterae.1
MEGGRLQRQDLSMCVYGLHDVASWQACAAATSQRALASVAKGQLCVHTAVEQAKMMAAELERHVEQVEVHGTEVNHTELAYLRLHQNFAMDRI